MSTGTATSQDTQQSQQRAKTTQINTKQGPTDYAKVAERIKELHERSPECSVDTDVKVNGGNALIKATVKNNRGTYTGHSFGQVSGAKALEKLETIAVGRALAFAGYLASGDIASFEEMSEWRGRVAKPNMFVENLKAEIESIDLIPTLTEMQGQISELAKDGTITSEERSELREAILHRAEHL